MSYNSATGIYSLTSNQNELEAGNGNVVTMIPNPLTTNYTIQLPIDMGIAGQVLSTDGLSSTSWITGGGGGGGSVNSVTAGNGSITIGGTVSNPTVSLNTANSNSFSVVQNLDAGLELKNSSSTLPLHITNATTGTATIDGSNIYMFGNSLSIDNQEALGLTQIVQNGTVRFQTTANNTKISSPSGNGGVSCFTTETDIIAPTASNINFLISGSAGSKKEISSTLETNTIPININNATNSTSISTGSLYTIGGIGLSQDIFVGGKESSLQQDLRGSISGTLSILPAVTTTSHSLTFPSAQGGASTVLSNNGSGILSWATSSGAVTSVSNVDSSLVISPTTGAVVCSLNTANTNSFSVVQNLDAGLELKNSSSTLPLHITNATTGIATTDGSNIYMFGNSLSIENQEALGLTQIVQNGTVRFQTTANNTKISSPSGNGDISCFTNEIDITAPTASNINFLISGSAGIKKEISSTLETNTIPISVNSAVNATSLTTGAIRTTGGVSIAQDIYVVGKVRGNSPGGILNLDADNLIISNVNSLQKEIITDILHTIINPVSITDTTDSSASGTGSLYTQGGISTGVNKSIYCGNVMSSVQNNLRGVISGVLNIQASPTTTSHTLTFPSAQGAVSTVLSNNGSGSLSWAAGVPSSDTYSSAGGTSIIKTKLGGDFVFKGLTVTSTKVALSANTNDVGIDVVPANIDILGLLNAPVSSVVGISDTQTLTNKTLVDSSTLFSDNLTPSKQMQFQLADITSGNNRILTIPDISDTLVTLSATQTLSNKTLNGVNNVITASLLKSASSEISISSANAPTSGQVLTAISPTLATWQSISPSLGIPLFFNNNTTSNLPPIKQLSSTSDVGTESSIAVVVNSSADVIIQTFITEVAYPNITTLKGGIWQFNLYSFVNTGTVTQIYAKLYKTTFDGVTNTLLGTSGGNYIPQVVDENTFTLTLGNTSFLSTDRIKIEIWATATGLTNRTVTTYFDGNARASYCYTPLDSYVGLAAVNNGTGFGIAQTPVYNTFNFKTLLGTTNKVGLTNNTDDITFNIGSDVVQLTSTQTLTNKTLVDSSTLFSDDLTPSKQMNFQLANITASNTRTLSVPDFNLTLGSIPSSTTMIATSSASAPTIGQVLTATSTSTANWQTPSGGGGGSNSKVCTGADIEAIFNTPMAPEYATSANPFYTWASNGTGFCFGIGVNALYWTKQGFSTGITLSFIGAVSGATNQKIKYGSTAGIYLIANPGGTVGQRISKIPVTFFTTGNLSSALYTQSVELVGSAPSRVAYSPTLDRWILTSTVVSLTHSIQGAPGNAVTFVSNASPTSIGYSTCIWCDVVNMFLAISTTGLVVESTTGVGAFTSSANSVGGTNISGMAYDSVNNILIVTRSLGTTCSRSSIIGGVVQPWTTLTVPYAISDVLYNSNLGYFVATSNVANIQPITYSIDGITWTLCGAQFTRTCANLSYIEEYKQLLYQGATNLTHQPLRYSPLPYV